MIGKKPTRSLSLQPYAHIKILAHHQLCHMQEGALTQFNNCNQPLVSCIW